MKYLLFITFSWLSLSLFSQGRGKTITLSVDVLGEQYQNLQYKHPINGNYSFFVYSISNKELKILKKVLPDDLLLIEPRKRLEGTSFIKANSLRYNCRMKGLTYVDSTSDDSNLEEYEKTAQEERDSYYQSIVGSYFEPYYFKKTEVSNAEYHEFVDWVKDSLFMECIYDSDLFTDEEVFEMLDIPYDIYFSEADLEWKEATAAERGMNRELFPFKENFDYRKEFGTARVDSVTQEFYLEPDKRFYRRRTLDVSKLEYTYYTFDFTRRYSYNEETKSLEPDRDYKKRDWFIIENKVKVYPDTTVWIKENNYPKTEMLTNLYFWHPAFNDYPVVGVSWTQANAFCFWKQELLNSKLIPEGSEVSVSLPRTYEVENAVLSGMDAEAQKGWNKMPLSTDLKLTNEEGLEILYEELYEQGKLDRFWITQKPHSAKQVLGTKLLKQLKKEYKKVDDKELQKILPVIYKRLKENYLPSGIAFLSNNVSEWMAEDNATNYDQLAVYYINYKHNALGINDTGSDEGMPDWQMKWKNDYEGKLIMGSNWLDERYASDGGVNFEGIFPTLFEDADSAYSTVGFRYVVRPKLIYRTYPPD